MHTFDLCLWKKASDGPHAVVWRRGPILAPPHQPNTLRVTTLDAGPPAIARPPFLHTPFLVGSASRPWQLAPPIWRVRAAWRKRGGHAPCATRPPHARRARRQRGGDRGAHQAQSGRSGKGERGASAGAAELTRRKAERARRRRGGDRGAHQAQSGMRGQGERGASAGAAEHTRRKAARARRQHGRDGGAPRARSDSRGPAELPGPLTPDAAYGGRRRRCHRRVSGRPVLRQPPKPALVSRSYCGLPG